MKAAKMTFPAMSPLSEVLADHNGEVPVAGQLVRVDGREERLLAVVGDVVLLAAPTNRRRRWTRRAAVKAADVLVDPTHIRWRAAR